MLSKESCNKLSNINWENIEEISWLVPPLLKDICHNRNDFKKIILKIKDDEYLFSLCEHYDILDKLVIFSDKDSGIRVRLHIFLPGYFDRPHNHRWNYASLILKGKYQHYIYNNPNNRDDFDLDELKITMSREETEGNFYTFHHSAIHSVVAEPFTVSLVARGPSLKDKFLVADKKTKNVWWQYGAKDEIAEEKNAKRMSLERVDYLLSKLEELQVI